MKGLTNAISQSGGGGGGGDTISAVNRTNATIREGDKVWINKNSVVPNSKYEWATAQYNNVAVADALVQIGCFNSTGYKLNDTEATVLDSITGFQNPNTYIYQEDGTATFVGSRGGIFTLTTDELLKGIGGSSSARLWQNGYAAWSTTVYKLDIVNGGVIKQWNISPSGSTCLFVYNNIAYGENYSTPYIWRLAENGSATQERYNHGCSAYVFGYTSDMKLAFATSGNNNNFIDNNNKVIYKISENGDKLLFTAMTSAELPTKLQAIMSSCKMLYNPKTGILSAANNSEYLLYKYENGSLKELAVDLGIGELIDSGYTITTVPMLSEDGGRAAILLCSSGGYYHPYTCLLQKTSEYNLVAYKSYMTTVDTLTGFANTDIQSGQSGEISTTLKAHVSYPEPEPEPEPGTEQYEINQDTQGGIVFVGDLQIVAGPYGNTVAQITDTTRLTLGNDGANIFAGMFADTQTADCFRIKFKMPRKGISSGGTWYALSDSLSQNVENPTDGCVRFGFTASWDEQNSEIDSQVVSFVMERYSSEQGWEILTEVIMPDFKLNTWYDVMYYYGKYADWEIEENGNSGYRLLINVYNEGGELIGREVYDNYPNGSIVSTENVQIGYPIYATSYFYIDVDLSQTGFQLLDSWVWRPVKEVTTILAD